MANPNVSLHHSVILDDQQMEGQLVDVGEALRRVAAAIGAQIEVKRVRDEPRYVLTKLDGPLELSIIAGHLYDTRENLTLSVELRQHQRLLASYGCASGIERIKLGPDSAWLRSSGGTTIILGSDNGGLIEIQD